MRHPVDFDVLIAGGGMVGNTLACALGNSGLRIALVESQPLEPKRAAGTVGLRVSAMTIASQQIFEQLGAWASMRDRAAAVEAMRVWEREAVLNYESADIGEPRLAWIIENQTVVNALAERLRSFENITLFCPEQLSALSPAEDHVAVMLAGGRRLTAGLIVGADGAQSKVRESLAIEWRRHDLGQTAIVAVVKTERPHAATAYQHFLPTGPLAFLPLMEPDQVSIVWSADNARAAELMKLDDTAFTTELQAAFGDGLGRVAVASPRLALPLALGFAQQYCAHRAALVGDAAHTVHPLAGQGVNLGILDAVTLANVIVEAASRRRDIGAHALLRRYERARKGADVSMQLITGGFRYLFGSRQPLVQGVRRAGLELTEKLPPVKEFFMREASGLNGTPPDIKPRRESR